MKLLLWLLRVRWLRPEPGDVLVVQTANSEAIARQMADEIRRVLPVGVKALIVPKGTTVRRKVADRSPPA